MNKDKQTNKIAYLINQYPKVSHTFIRRELNALEDLGFDIDRISIRDTYNDINDPRDIKEYQKTKAILGQSKIKLLFNILLTFFQRPWTFIKVLFFNFKLGYRSERGQLINLIYFIEACTVLQWTKTNNYTHIHAHFGTNSTSVVMLAYLMGGAHYSFTVHGPEEFDKGSAIKLTEKIHYAKFVVAITFYCRSQLYRYCSHNEWKKIHIIHCTIDSDYIEYEPSTVKDTNQLVCVGRICEQKGQELIVEAVAALIDKGVDISLVLVGDGEMREDVEKLALSRNISNHVSITGWATGHEVKQHILNSRALLLPSFAEGLPVVIMESFALGIPVLSTYVAGIPELVKPDENGWLVEASNLEALQDKIQVILSTPVDILTDMGSSGRQSVIEQHNPNIEAEKLMALINA